MNTIAISRSFHSTVLSTQAVILVITRPALLRKLQLLWCVCICLLFRQQSVNVKNVSAIFEGFFLKFRCFYLQCFYLQFFLIALLRFRAIRSVTKTQLLTVKSAHFLIEMCYLGSGDSRLLDQSPGACRAVWGTAATHTAPHLPERLRLESEKITTRAGSVRFYPAAAGGARVGDPSPCLAISVLLCVQSTH